MLRVPKDVPSLDITHPVSSLEKTTFLLLKDGILKVRADKDNLLKIMRDFYLILLWNLPIEVENHHRL
jgi:hypothetical protein